MKTKLYICQAYLTIKYFQLFFTMAKTIRKLKLQTEIRKTTNREKKEYPILLLKGKWLQDCGFSLDKHVEIIVREKLLVIKPIEN